MTRMDPRMADRRKAVQESHARRNLSRVMTVLGALAVAAAVAWAFRSPMLSIATIETTGAATVDTTALLAEIGIVRGVPLMDVEVERAVETLESDPWIASANVVRHWPTTISVQVEERIPVGWVMVSEGWMWVASDGVVLTSAPQPDPGVPSLLATRYSASDLAANPEVVGILTFMDALRSDLASGAVIDMTTSGFEATIAGYAVRLGSGDEGEAKARAVAAVIDTQPEPGSVITVMAPGQPAILPPGLEVEPQPEGEDLADVTDPQGG